MSTEVDEDGVQLRRRSFVFSKRLNIVSETRPKSLITYETNPPPLSPSPMGSSQTKAVPPVLARARQNFNLPAGANDQYSSNVTVYSTNNHVINVNRQSVDLAGGGANRRASLGPIEDLVLCSVCLERLKNPKMLNCQHTFCLVCLQSTFYQRKKLECPSCRQEQNVQDINDINALPSNLYISSLLKVLRGSSTSPTPLNQIEPDFEHHCIKCQTIVEVDNFQKCRHCKQKFCSVCWNDHLTALNDQLIKLGDQLNSAKEKIYHKLDEYKVSETITNHL